MKVLIISEYFPPYGRGGGEISAELLANALSDKGISVHILTSFFSECKREETKGKLKIFRNLKTGRNPASFSGNVERAAFFRKSLLIELKRLYAKEKYDIIHCMNITSIYAVELKKDIPARFILHVNSPVLFCPKGTLMYKDKEICKKKCTFPVFLDCFLSSKMLGKMSMPFLIKYNPAVICSARKRFLDYYSLIKRFDSYMAISSFMKEKLMFYGVEEKKIKIIYNIVDLEGLLKLKQPNNKVKKILYLGEYSLAKGPQILIDALKKLDVSYEASFFGEGKLKDYLIKESAGLPIKINEKAEYSKVPDILQKHDIVVIPSFVGEAFSRVALEAAAAKKTIIASDVGGIKDVVLSCGGYLYRNEDELLVYLKKALDKGIIPTLDKKFYSENILKEIIQTYQEVIEK
jgi:glycosyltransferase involved in cell wall biosynthesis